mmetsp:Transcript_1327/g.1502  ORF Transcript_1327/g.1502 Transcript_1327/m.1502 type:complete len:80 (-) Transcript_1327:150-389(-)
MNVTAGDIFFATTFVLTVIAAPKNLNAFMDTTWLTGTTKSDASPSKQQHSKQTKLQQEDLEMYEEQAFMFEIGCDECCW